MRRLLALVVVTAAVGLFAGMGGGAPPVEADPGNDYRLTPAFGPQIGEWMILVAYYTGPEAADLARQMAYKIRSQYNQPAYTFVYINEERKREKEQLDKAHAQALQMMKELGEVPVERKRRIIRVEEQYGVLIGAWADLDSANKALAAIRKLKAPEIQSRTGRETEERVFKYEKDEKTGERKGGMERVNPFSTAIVTRNPTLSKQNLANQVDPFIKTLNQYEDYSLLNCPCRYTLMVKEYFGASNIQGFQESGTKKSGGFLDTLGLGGSKPGAALDAAAAQAHELARVLRQLGFQQAYVLHQRTNSVVTIGGFDDLNDPAIQRVTQQLAQLRDKIVAQNKKDVLQLGLPSVVPIPRP